MVRLKTLQPMEARSVTSLPEGKQWRYEPKWDGFRCLAYKSRGRVRLQSKSGKPLDRYFPDIVAALGTLEAQDFILDGELLIEREDQYSFSDLQMRLHPAASRVQKLVAEAPATYMVFDILKDDADQDFLREPYKKRRTALERFFKKQGRKAKFMNLSPQTASLEEARQWAKTKRGMIDGLIAKNTEDFYRPSERLMQKFKFVRSADCVVGGFRYGTKSNLVGSLLLGLFDAEGRLNHVGFTSAIAAEDKPKITRKVEKLVGKPGFTGDTPGAPSRWSTERSAEWVPLKTKLVVEVSFDHATDNRFRHGTRLLRWRPDKAPKQCTMDQLAQPRYPQHKERRG